ncbi:MAG: hypothetical protein CRN43_17920 [Candidatus Nephrothrix sp. EaCA]|nr:MAG: hypothetical protein CRN43_17920 [Candidatus Nephrothrix sp. EaCA]
MKGVILCSAGDASLNLSICTVLLIVLGLRSKLTFGTYEIVVQEAIKIASDGKIKNLVGAFI